MSDVNSALPIRTEGDLTEKLQTRIIDATTDANMLTVNADGSVNVTDNGGSITVDATDLDIRDLVFATDKVDVTGSTVALDAPTLAALESITVQNGSGVDAVNIQDGGNSITVDATDLDIRDLTHASDSVAIGDGTDLLEVNTDGSLNANIRDGAGNALTSSAAGATRPLDVALRDAAGSLYSASNPLPVAVSVDSVGTEINNYNTASAVAAGGTSNHDYTTVSAFRLTQVEASASGKMKVEIQIETAAGSGTFNTVFVQFNSTANTNTSIKLASPISVTSGARVRVIRTNLELLLAQNLYSTISGQSL